MMKAAVALALFGAAVVAAAGGHETTKALASEFRLRRAQHRANELVRGQSPSKALNATGGTYGIDISGATCDGSSWNSATEFACFKGKGVNWAVVESHNGGLGRTNSIAHCTSEAHKAGIASVDLYSFWCPNCGGNTPAKKMMHDHVQWLKGQGVNYGRIWLDIETCSGCWNGAAANVQFIKDLAEGAAQAGASVGIYTNANEWSAVCGSDRSFASYPLWYAHYDNHASFSDFEPFGGWSHPTAKQFWDQSTLGCYSGVDMDWKP